MKMSWMAALLAACRLGVAEAQPADVPPSPRQSHAAECVAALEVETEALARRVKSGSDGDRAPLQSRLEAGAAFVGDSYLSGMTDEARGRALANQALEAQKNLSEAQLAARQQACAAEGTKMLETSNPLQQAVVKRLARRRMERLLRPDPASSASP